MSIPPLEIPKEIASPKPAPRRWVFHTLRLSVTDRCNFHCRYCVPARGSPTTLSGNLPGLEKLAGAVRWLVEHEGVRRVRITGGEPLVRSGVSKLVGRLTELPDIEEVTMTTNGSLLASLAKDLKRAGLSRVNVSLDSLDADRFSKLSRGGRLSDTLAGIDAALDAGLVPLKINAVLFRSSWQAEVPALLDFAATRGVEVRFLELMRTGTETAWADRELIAVDDVQHWLKGRANLRPLLSEHASTARRSLVTWRGSELVVGWISPRTKPFCASCNRMRLDARGRLRRCLMDPKGFPLLEMMSRYSGIALNARAENYLKGKRIPEGMDTPVPMLAVGG